MIRTGIEWRFDAQGNTYPELRVTVDGCHDVGRLAATLASGNCEHGDAARRIGRDLNRTADGRAVIAYLVGHGGPDLAPPPCDPCTAGEHDDCWHDPPEWVCGCADRDESHGAT